MRLRSDQQLYLVGHAGRLVRVTAICFGDDAANRECEAHPGDGVLAAWGPLVFLADVTDRGAEKERVR